MSYFIFLAQQIQLCVFFKSEPNCRLTNYAQVSLALTKRSCVHEERELEPPYIYLFFASIVNLCEGGEGLLGKIDGAMNAEKYDDQILSQHGVQSGKHLTGNSFIFQHDSDLKHTARAVKA